jgi:type II secretory pathway pseudopilin PulG
MEKKEGISLIVLVITIIVIIILAAAVILTLTDNNPINNAKVAQIAQNKDSIESTVSLYLAQNIAATQGSYDNTAIILGIGTDVATKSIAKTDPNDSTKYSQVDIASIGTVYEIDAAKLKTQTSLVLPSAISSSAKWCVQPESGKVYLVFDAITSYPTWMTVDEDDKLTDQNLAGFVTTGVLALVVLPVV